MWLLVSETIERITVSSSRAPGQVGEQLRDPETALTALAELPVRPVEWADLAEEGIGPLGDRHGLAVPPDELRLVVKRVHLAQAALEEDVDGAPGPGRVVRRWVGRISRDRRRGEEVVAGQEIHQGYPAQAGRQPGQEVAPGRVGRLTARASPHGRHGLQST